MTIQDFLSLVVKYGSVGILATNDNERLSYPRIPRDCQKRVKIFLSQYETIRWLKRGGWYYRELAQKYNVCESTIKYICLPHYYKNQLKRTAARQSYNYHNDPIYKKEFNQKTGRYSIERYRTDPVYRKWFIQMVNRK